jgi:hypothetical protein
VSCRVLERVRLDSQPRIPFNLEKQGGGINISRIDVVFCPFFGVCFRASLSQSARLMRFLGPFLVKHTEFRKLEPR